MESWLSKLDKESARKGPYKAQGMNYKDAISLMQSWGFTPFFRSTGGSSHCWFEKRDERGNVIIPHTSIGYLPQHGGTQTKGVTIRQIFSNAAKALGISMQEFLSGPKSIKLDVPFGQKQDIPQKITKDWQDAPWYRQQVEQMDLILSQPPLGN